VSIGRFTDKLGDFCKRCWTKDIERRRRNVRAWYMRRSRVGIRLDISTKVVNFRGEKAGKRV
jgi:hypothetical protein